MQTVTLTIKRGITFGPVTFEFTDDDGDPIDLTGWQVSADARKTPKAALAFSLAPEITDAAGGVVTMAFTDEQTAELPDGSYGWDMVLQNPGGERFDTQIVGRVTVKTINTQP